MKRAFYFGTMSFQVHTLCNHDVYQSLDEIFSTRVDPEDDWLVKTNSFLIGDFIFMLNTDWMAKRQLNVNSINQNILKEIRVL